MWNRGRMFDSPTVKTTKATAAESKDNTDAQSCLVYPAIIWHENVRYKRVRRDLHGERVAGVASSIDDVERRDGQDLHPTRTKCQHTYACTYMHST